ncbi:hypothetical protein IGL76_000264 [Enterococcus sp. DIV2381]|uniref:Uncharacterized protein n=1 Tax=Candidatus Enterococcus mangumiae TaxID=2230878 RepID=A0ABZ2SXN0_9ENTE
MVKYIPIHSKGNVPKKLVFLRNETQLKGTKIAIAIGIIAYQKERLKVTLQRSNGALQHVAPLFI